MTTHAVNNGNEMFVKHQSMKNQLLSEFKDCSSSELSFLRRVATLSLLDALCHLTGRCAKSLFLEPEIDFHVTIAQHRHDLLVVAFMLQNNIDPHKTDFSESDRELIAFCLSELSKHLAPKVTISTLHPVALS